MLEALNAHISEIAGETSSFSAFEPVPTRKLSKIEATEPKKVLNSVRVKMLSYKNAIKLGGIICV